MKEVLTKPAEIVSDDNWMDLYTEHAGNNCGNNCGLDW